MDNITEARPAAPSDAPHYTLTVEQTADRYEKAGVPRTIRRIQNYCARGDLKRKNCSRTEIFFNCFYRARIGRQANSLACVVQFCSGAINRLLLETTSSISIEVPKFGRKLEDTLSLIVEKVYPRV